MIRRHGIGIVLALGLAACGRAPQSVSSTHSIIGDLQMHLMSEKQVAADPFAAAMGSLTAMLADPEHPGRNFAVPQCSGIQVSPRHVLTAGHCQRADYVFNKRWIAQAAERNALSIQTFGDVVRLGFEGELVPDGHVAETAMALLGPASYTDSDLDMAVYELPTVVPGAFVDLAKVEEASQGLELLGFPNGVPLSVATGCQGRGTFMRGILRHDCDSLTGSSGGLLVDRGAGIAVAMQITGPLLNSGRNYEERGHFESAEELAERRGCRREAFPDEAAYWECVRVKGLNGALSLVAVRERLKQNAPDLWASLQRAAP